MDIQEFAIERPELVENEPTARPFQCKWGKCTKSFNRKSDLKRHYRIHTNERPYACIIPGCGKSFSQQSALTVHIRMHTGEKPHQCLHASCGKRFSDSSSLARHRRIHTGKRPYICGHDGCLKSFCRKATMVQHQRRSHQKVMNPSDPLHDCLSNSDSDDPPSTQTSSMTWSPQDMMLVKSSAPQGALHHASSYPGFGRQMHDYPLQQHQKYFGRQIIPFSVPPQFDPHTVVEQQVDMDMIQRTASVNQQSCYVTEQCNTGVATMTTSPVPPHYQLAQHQVERPSIEIHHSTLGMTASTQSSPSSYSATSVQSPLMQASGFYPPQQQHPPAYTIQPASPVDSYHTLPTYPQPMHQAISQDQQIATTQAHQQGPVPVIVDYPQLSSQPQEEHWPQYQPLVEVAIISQLPAYGTAVYDSCGPKIEFDDPTMQLPGS
ncbi:hypothetical protein B0T10DRAFT_533909 [Thelonectria olida]|uniref:C2H2-type domain-containing protein n=1 Tax=Thelonectria olida TaxID=1576542 RepID=A0A9P8VNP3_9HYPO|nr:hypothetical protein B0T10DRAFT_533909 [Thelonectria olida]